MITPLKGALVVRGSKPQLILIDPSKVDAKAQLPLSRHHYQHVVRA
jgi:hypothetical protein